MIESKNGTTGIDLDQTTHGWGKVLQRGEARRIAANVAKLPEVLRNE